MDHCISPLGSEVLLGIAAKKKAVKGQAPPLKAPDLKAINLDQDNKITVDELKAALAQHRGVAVESLVFVEPELAQLAEDALDLTTLLRRGGQLNVHKTEQTVSYVGLDKPTTLADLRTCDSFENPLTLQMGVTGEDIRKLHVLLNNLHAFEDDYVTLNEHNTVFDDTLKQAVASFQREADLLGQPGILEGVLDGQTLRRLEQLVENVVKETDIYTPYVPIAELPGVPDNDPQRLNVIHKIMDQLALKGLTATEIEAAFHTGQDLAQFLKSAIAKVESQIKGGSESFCYTGVKEGLEGALNYKYQAFGGKGGSWASTADDYLFRKRPDLFAELTLAREELNFLPAGAIVVYEPGGVGHIGIKDYNEKGQQLDLSDRVRTGRPYPNAKYKVFLPLKAVLPGDKAYANPTEAEDLSRLMYAARQTRARKARRSNG